MGKVASFCVMIPGLFVNNKNVKKGELVALLFLLSFAFWLRFRNLGALGLYGDEDHVYLAVKGIFDTGYPTMPSGVIYPRGIIYTYLSALSAALFGISEFSVRLPSVAFSVLVILMLYVIAKRIFDYRVALICSLIYSLSAWDIEISRFARMYETFLFFYLASVFCFYKGFVEGDRIYRLLTPFVFIITTTVHLLGIFLTVFFLCPFLIKDYNVTTKRNVILYMVITGLVSFFYYKLVAYIYMSNLTSILIAHAPTKKPAPDLSLFLSLIQKFRWDSGLLLLIIISICVFFLIRLRYIFKEKMISAFNLLVICLLLGTVLLQQYGLAFWIFCTSLFMAHRGLKGLKDPLFKTYALFLLTTFVVWWLWGFYAGMNRSPDDTALAMAKRLLLTLLDYPFITLRSFFHIMPMMTLIVLVGLLALFDRSSKFLRDGEGVIVLVGFLGPLIAIGFLQPWPYLHYLYMVYPLFLLIYVCSIVKIVEHSLNRIRMSDRFENARQSAVLLISVVLVFTFSNYHSYEQAKSISDRTYSSKVTHTKIFEYHNHPDHKNAFIYVKRNMKPNDIIIAIDNMMAYIYLDKADYLLRTEGLLTKGLQLTHELFIGSPVILNLDMLKDTLQIRDGRSVWLITSYEFMGPHLREAILSREVTKFLKENENKVVYMAEDTVTQVYLWEPDIKFRGKS